jgi:hypothetical protein
MVDVRSDGPRSAGPWAVPGSAVDHLLHRLGIALALHLHAAGGVVELGQVVRAELDLGGTEVLLETFEPAGAGDRDDPRLLREQPGQGDLAERDPLALRDLPDQVDQREVGPEGIGLEAGQGGPICRT